MKYKIKNKLALYSINIALMCFLLCGIFLYQTSVSIMKRNIANQNLSQVHSIIDNMDFLLRNIDEEADILAGNESIQILLNEFNQLNKTGNLNSIVEEVDEVFSDFILKESKYVEDVQIISKKFGSSLKLKGHLESLAYNYNEINELLNDKEQVWLSNIDSKGIINDAFISTYKGKIIFVKRINNKEKNEDLGILLVFLRYNVWEKILSGININLNIASDDGEMIYQYGKISVDKDFYDNDTNKFLNFNNTFTRKLNGKVYLVTYAASEYTGWKIALYIDIEDISAKTSEIRYTILITGFLCFICSVLFSLALSYRITKPINIIKKLIGNISRGNIDNKFDVPKTVFNRVLGNKFSIISIYIVIIVLPIIVSITIIYNISSDFLTKQSLRYYQNEIVQVSKKIDLNIQNYNNIISYIFGDKKLNKVLREFHNGKITQEKLERDLNQIVLNYQPVARGDIGLSIIDNNRKSVYYTRIKQIHLYEQLKTIENNKVNRTLWFPTVYDSGTYLTNFGKRLIALENDGGICMFDRLGFIVLTLNEYFVERMYRSSFNYNESSIYIMDSEGKVVSHPDKSHLRNIVESNYILNISNNPMKNGYMIIKKVRDEYAVAYSKIASTGWIVVSEVPMSFIISDINKVRSYSILLILANVIIISLFTTIFIYRITNPIRNLNNAMAQVASGDIDVKVDITSGDEVQKLCEGFNTMIGKLKELMEDNYNQGLRRREAELNALQAQINPHFLYNTLESINWEVMMLTDGPNNASKMVTALSKLLRLSINRGKEIVTFEDEMSHVKNYLVIQKERYADKFDVEWDIETDLYKYKTLKLILQPLVENAIYHGLELKEDNGIIIIKGEVLDDCIKISIIDDGIGMSEEQLDKLNRLLSDGSTDMDSKRGIGVKNVNDRIQLYFGNKYGLKVFSRKNSGTTIEIYLPLHMDEGKEGII